MLRRVTRGAVAGDRSATDTGAAPVEGASAGITRDFLKFLAFYNAFYEDSGVLGGPGRSWEVLGRPRKSQEVMGRS